MPSVRGVPQHCPVSTQCLLMTSVREKLICRPWEGPGLDIRSAEVKHIRLLTRYRFSLGKKMKPSLTDTSRQNYKLATFYRNVFHLSSGFLFPRCVCFCLSEMQMEKKSCDECRSSKPFLSLILLCSIIRTASELLSHSYYEEALITSDRLICSIDVCLRKNHCLRCRFVQRGWPMAAETKWLITEKFGVGGWLMIDR